VTKSHLLLSIVLPIRNIQNSLPSLVSEVMETVCDFVPHFEVVLVDNGSTDHTDEIAADLALQYPQVSSVQLTSRLDDESVIRTGYAHASGQVVLIQRENTSLQAADMMQLARLSAERGLVVRPLLKRADPAIESQSAAAASAPRLLNRNKIRRNGDSFAR